MKGRVGRRRREARERGRERETERDDEGRAGFGWPRGEHGEVGERERETVSGIVWGRPKHVVSVLLFSTIFPIYNCLSLSLSLCLARSGRVVGVGSGCGLGLGP